MQTITREELKHMNGAEEDFVLINVLSRKHFNEQHIRTSINIPVDENDFAEKVEAVAGSKSRKVMVYCASTECNASPRAAQQLQEAGFTDVYDDEGGTRDWFAQKNAA